MDNWDLYNYIHGGKSGSNATVDGIIDRSIKSIKNDRVTNIGAYAFYGCSQLTSIDFPNVTAIGAYAFRGCIKLTSVEFPNVTSTISDNIFYGCTQLISADFANAYSCAENLKLRHLFRVLGKPNGSYPLGSVEVGTKKLFWFGRYALEYEKDE